MSFLQNIHGRMRKNTNLPTKTIKNGHFGRQKCHFCKISMAEREKSQICLRDYGIYLGERAVLLKQLGQRAKKQLWQKNMRALIVI